MKPTCQIICISFAVFLTAGLVSLAAHGDEPLHVQIDRLIEARSGTAGAAIVDDAGFLRRIYLDFAGMIPSADAVRNFLADQTPDKRQRLIDDLLNSPHYARAMRERFHILLMERRGDQDEWTKYLEDSFAANKPFDQLAREILNPNPEDEATRAAAFFMTKRLESYGQNPTDFPGLTRDVARLFLGQDLQCAQCHNHLFIDQYKQVDFQGLYIVFMNLQIRTDVKFPAVKQNPLKQKLDFVSVFDSTPRSVGPRLPGGTELPVTYEPEAKEKTEPAQSDATSTKTGLALFAETIPTADNMMFTRNAANRIWFLMMGRGLVHPLDLHHQANPPSHPELLDLLAREFAAQKFDLKWLLRELALTNTYQRTSLMEDAQQASTEDSFLVFKERRLSAEQLMWSVLEATGETERVSNAKEAAADEQNKDAAQSETTEATDSTDDRDKVPTLKDLQKAFVDSFANEPREPEEMIEPSVKGALFWRNDQRLLTLLQRRTGNLVDRLTAMTDDQTVADELYLSVLSRLPSDEERNELSELLKSQPENREKVLSNVAWALLASVEFFVNH